MSTVAPTRQPQVCALAGIPARQTDSAPAPHPPRPGLSAHVYVYDITPFSLHPLFSVGWTTCPSIRKHTHKQSTNTSSSPLVRVAIRTCPSYKYRTGLPVHPTSIGRTSLATVSLLVDLAPDVDATAKARPCRQRGTRLASADLRRWAPPPPLRSPRGGGPASRAASLVGIPSARRKGAPVRTWAGAWPAFWCGASARVAEPLQSSICVQSSRQC